MMWPGRKAGMIEPEIRATFDDIRVNDKMPTANWSRERNDKGSCLGAA
jgi:hypothetical protein